MKDLEIAKNARFPLTVLLAVLTLAASAFSAAQETRAIQLVKEGLAQDPKN